MPKCMLSEDKCRLLVAFQIGKTWLIFKYMKWRVPRECTYFFILFFRPVSSQRAERKWLSLAFKCEYVNVWKIEIDWMAESGGGSGKNPFSLYPLQRQLLSPCQQLPGYRQTRRHSFPLLSPSNLNASITLSLDHMLSSFDDGFFGPKRCHPTGDEQIHKPLKRRK